jgi:hypothetical protein
MPFKEGNQYGKVDKPLAKAPLSIKLDVGEREKVMAVTDWSSKLRVVIKEWLRQQP